MQTISKQKTKLLEAKNPHLLSLFVTASLSLGVLNFVAIMLLVIVGISIASEPEKRLAELPNGVTRSYVALDTSSPSPKAVRQSVAQKLHCLFDWRGILPPADLTEIGNPKPDPGIPVTVKGKELKITTSTWRCSFALDDPFRRTFVGKLAELTPQGIFNPGGRTSWASLVPRDVGVPQQTQEGEWQVPFTAMLMFFENGDNLGRAVPLKYMVYLRETARYQKTEQLSTDEPEQQEEGSDVAETLEQVIQEAQADGLLIYAMQERN